MDPKSHMKVGLADEDAFSESLSGEDLGETARLDERRAGDSPAKRDLPPHIGSSDAPGVPGVESEKWKGKRLGHFKLLRPLGAGAMGLVIQALDLNLDRIVALKVLRKRSSSVNEKEQVRQFLREARAAAKINHPNVAQIYEINEHDGWWYVAAEMIEGGTLREITEASGKLPPMAACPLIADAASALAEAHKLGIIHRDIKPANLMLTRSGRCKVVDFGLVRIDDPNDPFDFTRLTVGTPDYLPPESGRRERITAKSDIYSLGGTLYFTLTGKTPFKARTLTEIIEIHRTAPRPDPRESCPECSDHLAELTQRAMAIDPEERPDADQFAAELRVESIGSRTDLASLVGDPNELVQRSIPDSALALQGLSASRLGRSATHAGARARPRTRVVTIGAAVLALALVGAAALWLSRPVTITPKDAGAFEARFPSAPATYGLRPEGELARGSAPAAPSFSWKGRIDPGAARFVGATSGRRAFALEHSLAPLISADNAEFFADRATVMAAGKEPVE